jgi:hypothetical protein
MVALIKEQVEGSLNGRKSGGEVLNSRDVEQSFGSREHFLSTRDALLDSGLATEECVCDFTRTEAAQDVKHKGNLDLFRESGMAAGKHHPELIVFDQLC